MRVGLEVLLLISLSGSLVVLNQPDVDLYKGIFMSKSATKYLLCSGFLDKPQQMWTQFSDLEVDFGCSSDILRGSLG